MNKDQDILSAREIRHSDIDLITEYWLNADSSFLVGMGVDLSKMPSRKQWTDMLTEQLRASYQEKKSYCVIWQVNNVPIGHSNINKITYAKEAFMHLHLWHSPERKKGMGTQLVQMTLPYYFENFKLKTLYCEPYALNPAPNKTLEKSGFKFIREYVTTPGMLNFEQSVNLWELGRERFEEIRSGQIQH